MTAFGLAAVGGTSRQTGVAFAANLLVTVVLLGKYGKGRLNNTTTQAKHEVKGTFLLNIVVRESAAVFELLAGEDQTLLIGGNALLVLDLALHVLDSIAGLHIKGDGFARKGLNEDLYEGEREKERTESRG